MKSLVESLTPPIVLSAAWRIRMLPQARKARAIRPRAKLHFGCGSNIKQGWINIDLSKHADIQMDLSRKLPIPDNVASKVYSEHFLEHLDYPEPAGLFVRECFRILEPGGSFSVGVPDTEWPLKSYAGNHEYEREAKARNWHPNWCSTELEHINYHFRQGTEHRFAYDLQTLSGLLDRSGFVNIRRRDADLSLDRESRAFGTLYVDAERP